ncbi:MAG: YggT family protein [Firmicutes bacterium]|nr:YggT family protein [Clostridiales bacterium]MBQ9930965.1 YggT family protein [Bacillota bacterium]
MVLITAVNLLFRVLIWMLVIRAVMSWFVRPGDVLFPLYRWLWQVTEPLLAPSRKILYRFGAGRTGIDFSPMLTLILLYILQRIIVAVLASLLF